MANSLKQTSVFSDSGWFYDLTINGTRQLAIIYRDLVMFKPTLQRIPSSQPIVEVGKAGLEDAARRDSSWGTPTIYEGKTRVS